MMKRIRIGNPISSTNCNSKEKATTIQLSQNPISPTNGKSHIFSNCSFDVFQSFGNRISATNRYLVVFNKTSKIITFCNGRCADEI
jgi:hypothetical protein